MDNKWCFEADSCQLQTACYSLIPFVLCSKLLSFSVFFNIVHILKKKKKRDFLSFFFPSFFFLILSGKQSQSSCHFFPGICRPFLMAEHRQVHIPRAEQYQLQHAWCAKSLCISGQLLILRKELSVCLAHGNHLKLSAPFF